MPYLSIIEKKEFKYVIITTTSIFSESYLELVLVSIAYQLTLRAINYQVHLLHNYQPITSIYYISYGEASHLQDKACLL